MTTFPTYQVNGSTWYKMNRLGVPATTPTKINTYYNGNWVDIDLNITKDNTEYIGQIYTCVTTGTKFAEITIMGFYLYLKNQFKRQTDENSYYVVSYSDLGKNLLNNYTPSNRYHVYAGTSINVWYTNITPYDSRFIEERYPWIYAVSSLGNYGWASGWNLSLYQNMKSSIETGILSVVVPNNSFAAWAVDKVVSNISDMVDVTTTFISTSQINSRTFYLKTSFSKDTTQSGNVVNYESYYGTKYTLILYLYLFYQLLNSQYHMVLITLY